MRLKEKYIVGAARGEQAPGDLSVLLFFGGVNMNCWEFMKCGREAGGSEVYDMGICVAYPNEGKKCAQVAGTLCGGKVQGSYAMKIFDCIKCDFYNSEYYEHDDFKVTSYCNTSSRDN
ncbi:MAG: hypothetical protein JRD64_03675 [Deltaproteobacteria bacterium]|nr:hypothetical protein [Deltaproteobacteria bacterium]